MTRVIKFIPRSLRALLSKVFYSLEYGIGTRLGWRDPLLPPNSLHFVGGLPEFKGIGESFFQYFVNLAGLQPHERVLDVGCGTGRMALPLTKYLKDGSYDGIDIVAPSIKWCQKTYTPSYPHFHFHFADIHNEAYNCTGKEKASDYRFPFENSSFDFVFLTSVFTHLLPRDADNYLSETMRVIDEQASHLSFKYELPGCQIEDKDVPEAAVGYDEKNIRSLFGTYGLSVAEPIRYGTWCGRKAGLDWQDIIIATKHYQETETLTSNGPANDPLSSSS
jgi:ubiquinone/menaquinone biosynthesis C-methylase UbiE